MLGSIYAKAIRDRYVGLLIAAVSFAAICWMGVAVYKSVGPKAMEAFSLMPEAFLRIAGLTLDLNASAMVLSEMANFIAPLVLCGIAIVMGADAIAGEERWGTMGPLLGNPRSRTRVVLEKSAALVTIVVIGTTLFWGGYYAALGLSGESSAGMHLGGTAFHLGAIALFFGAMSLAVGAWTGDTTRANATATTVMLVSLFGAGLLPLLTWGEAWAKIFPWWYIDGAKPMVNGVHWSHVALLGGLGVAMLGLAVVGVVRRDLKVGEARTTFVDRLRARPRFASLMDKVSGRAQVSSIAAKATSDVRGILLVAGGTMFYMTLILGPMFKGVGDKMGDLVDAFPREILAMVGFADYSTPSGWYQGEIFSIMGPIAVALVAIAVASRALAGEERDRTMGLLLANPVTRPRVVWEKAAAMIMAVISVSAMTFVGVVCGDLIANLDLSYVKVAAICVHMAAFGVFIGAVTLAVGAVVGVARAAIAAGWGVLTVSYVVATILPINPDLAGWARWSPFYYYSGHLPLENGFSWGFLGVLAGGSAALVALSAWAFEGRDLRG